MVARLLATELSVFRVTLTDAELPEELVGRRLHPVRRPLSSEQALAYVDSWLHQPYVAMVGSGEEHWPILRGLLLSSRVAGNLTSDAHVAALALEQGATVYSADNDFKRFAGIKHVDPLSS